MPIRTNQDLVAGVIEWDDDAIPDLTPFIEAASQLVDDVCTSSGYADTKLLRIETWLAAHFYAIRDPRAVREEVSVLRTVYQGETKLWLDHTSYGQQAKILDTAGNLAALQNKLEKTLGAKKSIQWLGTDPEE